MPVVCRVVLIWMAVLGPVSAGPKAPVQTAPHHPKLLESSAPFSVEAETIQALQNGDISASGNVEFTGPQGVLRAETFFYNYKTGIGQIVRPVAVQGALRVSGEKGTAEPGVIRFFQTQATTCDREHSDYKIAAREIDLYPGQRIVARKVSLWLGGVRLLTVPKLSISLSRSPGARRSLLPRVGADSRDGLFLGYGLPLVSSPRSYLALGGRLTEKSGIQGGISAERLVSGQEAGVLSPAVIDPMLELRDLPMARISGQDGADELSARCPPPSQLRLFANATYNQRAFDIGTPNLVVSRLPEVGLKWSLPSVQLATSGSILSCRADSSVLLSYARISELPGRSDVRRLDARALVSVSLTNPGRSTVLGPVFLARYSDYDTPSTFRVLAGALNLAHVLSSESYASLRFIRYFSSGNTPLEVDDIDIEKELQAAGQFRLGRNFLAGTIDYDLVRSSIRDWSLTYGRTLHCLEPRITWRNRFRSISLDVKVIGL